MLYSLIVISALATSVLSGLVGMAGGVVLMAILINILPVSSAMVLHGITQFTANGSRTLILRRFLLWRLLPGYLLGAALAVAGFSALLFIPDASVVLILVGFISMDRAAQAQTQWFEHNAPSVERIVRTQCYVSSAISWCGRPATGYVLYKQRPRPTNRGGQQGYDSNLRPPSKDYLLRRHHQR